MSGKIDIFLEQGVHITTNSYRKIMMLIKIRLTSDFSFLITKNKEKGINVFSLHNNTRKVVLRLKMALPDIKAQKLIKSDIVEIIA